MSAEGVTGKMRALLDLIAGERGVVDSSDYGHPSPLDPYVDDRGRGTDTFNLAHEAGYLRTSHDSDSDTSTTRITPAGLAALTAETGGRNEGS